MPSFVYSKGFKTFLACLCIGLATSFLSLVMVVCDHFMRPSTQTAEMAPLQEPKTSIFTDVVGVQTRLERGMSQYLDPLEDKEEIAIAIESGDGFVQYLWNGDKVFEAASLYKLPLAMYFCDQIEATNLSLTSSIEYTEDSVREEGWNPIGEMYGVGANIPLQEVIESSLTNSDNIAAAILYNHLGGWERFATIEQQYSSYAAKPTQPLDNVCTAKQVLDELRLVQENATRYNLIISSLSQAQSDEYLNAHIPNGTMAQKYGQLEGLTNAAGFSITGAPYRIVVLSMSDQCDQDAGRINEIVWHIFNEALGNSVEVSENEKNPPIEEEPASLEESLSLQELQFEILEEQEEWF